MRILKHLGLICLIAVLLFSGCSSDEEKKQIHFEKGKALFEKGDFKSARLEFKNAIQIDPKFVTAQLKLAETELKLGNAREAYRAYLNV